LTAKLEYKFFGNYREVINLRDVEYCDALRDPESAAAKVVKAIEAQMQGMLHKCPYLPGPLRMTNFTDGYQIHVDNLDKSSGNMTKDFKKTIYKGDMRLTMKLSTDDDKKGLDLMVAYTLSFRNADTF